MSPPDDETVVKIEAAKRQSAGGAGPDDSLKEQLRAAFNEAQRKGNQSKPAVDLRGSDNKSGEQLPVSPERLLDPSPQPKPAGDMHEVLLGIGRHLNNATAALETIHGQLLAMEQQTKRRSSGGFARYLLAMCIGVAATLAWLSYGEAAKQIIATKAPELGWSPDAKQLIAGWVQQLGWGKTSVVAEGTAAQSSVRETQQLASAVQSVPENVAPKAPVAPSIDPEQVHQIASDVAAQRQTIEQLAAGQDQMARVVNRLEGAVAEILVKMPEPPSPPPVAAAVPAPKPKPKPLGPPSSRAPGPPYLPPHP
jgi:hypothetical protein